MHATRRVGLGLWLSTLLLAAAGCGGAEATIMGPPAKGAPADRGAAMPAEAPADAALAPPPPPSSPAAEASGVPGMGALEIEDSTPAAPSAAPRSPTSTSVGGAAKKGESEEAVRRAEPKDRPGLGTEWGETRFSRISTVPFVRADPATPFATAAMFYNDEEGARSMANTSGFRRTSGGFSPQANGVVSVGLRDERGGFLSGFVASNKSFIVGEAGRRYAIVVRNNTDSRLEIVLSVDGLDVLDGRAASFAKRGYLVDPRGELEVDGFRQSMDTVAAFRFGSVRGSYAAQKTGDSRNVGVIGVAIFNERGTNPFPWTSEELQRRHDANPFPGQFATPP
jgi:hypothetical protein